MKSLFLFLFCALLAVVWRMSLADTNTTIVSTDLNDEASRDFSSNTTEMGTSSSASVVSMSSTQNTNETGVKHSFSEELIACTKVVLDHHEYVLWDNLSVYVKIYDKEYTLTNYYIAPHGLVVCLPQVNKTNETSPHVSRFDDSFNYITIIGLSLSSAFLILHLIGFALVSEVRNLPGYCLSALSISLLMAYLLFLFSSFSKPENCVAIGYLIYYFFLSSFFWMNAISFDVWRSLRLASTQLRLSSKMQQVKLLIKYAFYGWGGSACIVVLCRILEVTESVPVLYRPSFEGGCWFSHRRSLLVFFATPLFVIMALNVLFFGLSTYIILTATMKTSQDNASTLKRNFVMFLKLAVITGLTWVFGIIAGSANHIVLWYIYVIFNASQGVFIFVVFSCMGKMRHYVRRSLKSFRFMGFVTSKAEASVATTNTLSQSQSTSVGV